MPSPARASRDIMLDVKIHPIAEDSLPALGAY